MVYLLRWWACNRSDLGKDQLAVHKKFLEAIGDSICRELKEAQQSGELAVRPEFESIVEHLLLPYGSSFMLVTTNWDTVAPNALSAFLRGAENWWEETVQITSNGSNSIGVGTAEIAFIHETDAIEARLKRATGKDYD